MFLFLILDICLPPGFIDYNPEIIYLFKVNNRNTRKKCEICSNLQQRHQNDVMKDILVSLLLTLNILHTFL